MIKKRTHIICCAMFLAVACVGLVACGGGDSSGVSKKIHDRTKWFTEEELSEKGLAGLTAPTGLSGEINSSDAWFNVTVAIRFRKFARTKQRLMQTPRRISHTSKPITPGCSVYRESKNIIGAQTRTGTS